MNVSLTLLAYYYATLPGSYKKNILGVNYTHVHNHCQSFNKKINYFQW